MSESLRSLLSALDFAPRLTWTYADIERWPEGEFDRCLASGLFVSAEPSLQIACTECGEIADVLLPDDSSSSVTNALILCPECGPHRVPVKVMSSWKLDLGSFLDSLCRSLSAVGQREELVRGRVWRLGKRGWAHAQRNLYLARALHKRDAWQIVNEAAFAAGAVVLVPEYVPEPDARTGELPTVVPLTEVISWAGNQFAFDEGPILQSLAARPNVGQAIKNRAGPSRASRRGVVQAIQREVEQHLRAARDHAFHTRERNGTAELLPRPTQEFLARQVGVHKSTVSRCLEDQTARELRLLWETAADLDRILDLAARLPPSCS
jgi:hypothetical protein